MIADGQLTEHEQRIVTAAGTGEIVDLRVGDTEADDPARGATWAPFRTIRAELLVELLTAERTPKTGRSRAIRIRGAHVVGPLDVEARTLICPLMLQECSIADPINLDEATAPTIRLPGCRIPALSARQLRTTGNLELDHGFIAEGEVTLVGAKIGGQLSFNQASLRNPDGSALNADGLTVEQSMFCQDGFGAEGEVRLLGARIGGQLSFTGAFLRNPDGPALSARRLTVEQSMFCRHGFTAEGEVTLLGARIGGRLSFNQASLRNSGGLALDLETAIVGELHLWRMHSLEGTVDFTNARVGVFRDDQATWPVELRLRGFSYETLENEQVGVRDRLSWLKLHRGYTPGIYDQLATAYRRAGNTEAARRVGVAKQWRRRSVFNPINWLLYLTIGYGYRTWLAALWLTALAVLGSTVFARAGAHHLMQPGPNAPPFHAVAYAVDVLVPIIDLGQRKSWTPHGSALYWSWGFITAGWILTTAVVAGLTGIFKRD